MSKKLKTNNSVTKLEKLDKSLKVFQRDKINFTLDINQRYELTDNQKKLIDIITDKKTRVVFLSGPAGTSKTYTSIIAALQLLNAKTVSDIIYIRNIVESGSKSLGSLPGEADEKFSPFLIPLYDKLEELLPSDQVKALIKDNRVQGIPINFLRGASFNAKCIIVDEAQNMNFSPEIVTILTRIGKFSKFIITGDPLQSDIGNKSGFMKMFDLFNCEESKEQGIACFSFTKEDIVRSGILKYIVEKIETADHNKSSSTEPMFLKG